MPTPAGNRYFDRSRPGEAFRPAIDDFSPGSGARTGMRNAKTSHMIISLVRGALAGAGATVVMTIVMVVSERIGLMDRHPPEHIVERGMTMAGEPPSRQAVDVAAGAAHFAFGTACGAAFGLLVSPRASGTVQLLAMPWAIAIWLVSYFGWIPALRILPPPSEDRPGRAWTMLAAHVVYGATLGALWRRLSRG